MFLGLEYLLIVPGAVFEFLSFHFALMLLFNIQQTLGFLLAQTLQLSLEDTCFRHEPVSSVLKIHLHICWLLSAQTTFSFIGK